MEIKDYRLQVRVKNNYLLEKMEERGIKTAADLSRLSGVSQVQIGHMINLKVSALTNLGHWRTFVLKVSEVLSCLPEDIYPEQHIDAALEKNKSQIKVDKNDLREFMGLLESEATTDPVAFLESRERAELVRFAISCLPERSRDVLERRLDDVTLAEVGGKYDISRERVRQIEMKARRKVKTWMMMIDDGRWPPQMPRPH